MTKTTKAPDAIRGAAAVALAAFEELLNTPDDKGNVTAPDSVLRRHLTTLRTAIEQASAAPAVMLVDGGDWVITKATPGKDGLEVNPRKAFREYHGRAPSRGASVTIVPASYMLEEGGLTYSKAGGTFEPVKLV